MPTERFYRLPKEKAEAIRMAAIKEFKRVPPEEASINRIIRDADISRGSFYTYFEDKKELLKWIINDSVKETQRFYVRTILENGGDIWDLFDRMLDNHLRLCEKDGFMEIIENLMRSGVVAEVFQLDGCGDEKSETAQNKLSEWIYRRCDKTKCPLDEKGFRDLMEMQMLSLIVAIKQYFRDHCSIEEVRKAYFLRIHMLHYGVDSMKKSQIGEEGQEKERS